MKIAWVMLFNYHAQSELYISGIYIDLARIWSYLQKIAPEEIYIYTDIDNNVDVREISRAINIPLNTPNIYSEIKQAGCLYLYQNMFEMLDEARQRIIRRAEQLFFYFGGHMDKMGNILLPDEKLPALQLLSLLDNFSKSPALITMIWDCCNTGGDFLPFLHNGIKLVHNSSCQYYWHKKILLICPEEDEQIPSPRGSNFTRQLFMQLKKGQRMLKNARIYSSQPNLVLPTWLYIEGKISVSLRGESIIILHNVPEENN